MKIIKTLKNHKHLIDLSNKNIKGVLDLENICNPLFLSNKELLKLLKYNNIEKLNNKYKYVIEIDEIDCSNNEITEIINIPYTLKYLNCSYNKITSLLNLPDYMTGLNCKKNPLKELYYPFYIKPIKYPSKLIYLKFGNKFNQPIDNLPNSLTHLTFGDDFNQPIDNLPNSLTHLTFDSAGTDYYCGSNSHSFNQSVDSLPSSLTHLTFNDFFDNYVDNLPNSLTHLTFGIYFNKPINNLPLNLLYLKLSSEFDQVLDNLPDNLQTFILCSIGNYFDEKTLISEPSFNQPINKLPLNLQKFTIDINIIYINQFEINFLPPNLKEFNLNIFFFDYPPPYNFNFKYKLNKKDLNKIISINKEPIQIKYIHEYINEYLKNIF